MKYKTYIFIEHQARVFGVLRDILMECEDFGAHLSIDDVVSLAMYRLGGKAHPRIIRKFLDFAENDDIDIIDLS